MDLELKGQTAIVVGAAKGIGRAIAEAFAAEQAGVVLLDVDPQVAQTAHQIGENHQVLALGMVADARDYAALQQVRQQVLEQSSYRHLVYAAGAGSGKYGFPFWNLEPADWPRVLDINLVGAVNAAHAFCPPLVAQRAGSVLFLSSVAGQIGSQTDPPYSAAKAGLINFSQCAAKDLAPFDVRVNTICPGMVQTDVNRSVWQAWYNQQPAELRLPYQAWAGEKVKRVAPLGRWQSCEEIAALAVFLASSKAHNITGQTMNVDGGQVM